MGCIFEERHFRPNAFRWVLLLVCLFSSCFSIAGAGQSSRGGRISGTITDPSGAVIPGAAVSANNADTDSRRSAVTDGNGFYSITNLPVGRYELGVTAPSFRSYRRTSIAVDEDSVLTIDVVLTVGDRMEAVTVTENPVHVDAASTHMGGVLAGTQMTTVPLSSRAFTDLLVLQPGVAPASSITTQTVADVGASVLAPSGDLNPGTISINGQREFANGFTVNGSDVEENVNMGTAIVPNLDSIAELRILTNNFDAEYGEFSGGQISVVTKSGTNTLHGDVFEFAHNTDLNARNFFSPSRGAFDKHQFGGTLGGPIHKSKIFYFADYQGTRSTQGVDSGEIPVPSLQDRAGNLSDLESAFVTTDANGAMTPTKVNGPNIAAMLSKDLGYAVSAGEPYFSPGCTAATCVFPNGVIPQNAWSAPAKNLLAYIPAPNNANGTFATSAADKILSDNKGAVRLDANTRAGMLSAYYFLDDWSQNNPYPLAQGGANVPGFNAMYTGRGQLLAIGDTKPWQSTAVNEFHFSFMRDANDMGKPIGGVGVSLASQGFEVGPGTPGIVPLSPATEGVESVGFNSYTIGTNTNELRQVNNTFSWSDDFSKVLGVHTLRFGGQFHYDQVNVDATAQFNGSFLFFGSETGSDFADFLLGLPSQYNQSEMQAFYGRNKYVGLYAQDSWRVRRSLTLNYGLRWDRVEPWYEKYNQIATFVPGRRSVVFPGAPAGILYPTDPGVPRTLGSPGNLDFAPRVGVAYAPSVDGRGALARLLGNPGTTSLRASYGIFYTAIEAVTLGVMSANAPYGITYTSPSPPLFATPFVTATTGQNLGQYFPVKLTALNASSSHPDNSVNWTQFEPIVGVPNYLRTNRIPYTEEYMVSLERGFGANTVFSVSYMGTEGHRLLVLEEANPGQPSLCLSLSNPSNLAPGQTPCGPFGEDNAYLTAAGRVYNGTRGPLGSYFGSNANQTTIGNSSYNALQLTLKHTSKRLSVLAGYTFSKSLDESSNVGEAVNPIDPALSRALSAFDVRQNFVVSYRWQVPLENVLRVTNRWTRGWELSGITRFSTGLPVTLLNYGDNSLLGSEPNGINNFGVDQPDYDNAPLNLNRNPRNGRAYFNVAAFSGNALGTPGTANRRFFHGPGADNYDMAVLKNLPLSEAKSLQFRVEAFNVFNHAQFFGPQAVDGNIDSSTFGRVVSAAPARLLEVGAKFVF